MKSNVLTLALAQHLPKKTVKENLAMGLYLCEQAKRAGADLILFPEMWSIGYNQPLMTSKHSIHGEYEELKPYRKAAKDLGIAIAITYLGMGYEKPTNNIMLIEETGRVIFQYAKVHVCDFKGGTETALEPGNSFVVGTIKISGTILSVGAMICFDREFPESARSLALLDAQLILVPNSCKLATCSVLGDVRLQQVRSRAFENMVAIAVANYPEPKDDGSSCLVGPDGKIIARAGAGEEMLITKLDLDFLTKWREREVWGVR